MTKFRSIGHIARRLAIPEYPIMAGSG